MKPHKRSTPLTIGIAAYREICLETWMSTLNIRGAWPNAVWDTRKGASVTYSRNAIAHSALERGSKTLIILDADMVFDKSHFARLLSSIKAHPECGAICGLYSKWDGSGLPVLNWRHTNGSWYSDKDRASRASYTEGLVPVDSFGGGFLAIDCKALRHMPFPWFKTGYEGPLPTDFYGNDTGFCRNLIDHGYTPSVDFDIVLAHVGPTLWVPQQGPVKEDIRRAV